MTAGIDIEYDTCASEFAQDTYEGLLEGFYKSAERIRDKAQSLVPYKTGKLHNTIRARKSKKKGLFEKFSKFIFSDRAYYQDDPAAFVFAGDWSARATGKYVWYHYMVEFGTYDSPARPFLRPAAYANFNAVNAEAAHMMKRVMNKKRRMRKRIRAISEITATAYEWKKFWQETGS